MKKVILISKFCFCIFKSNLIAIKEALLLIHTDAKISTFIL